MQEERKMQKQQESIKNIGLIPYLVEEIQEGLYESDERLEDKYLYASDLIEYAKKINLTITQEQADEIYERLESNAKFDNDLGMY